MYNVIIFHLGGEGSQSITPQRNPRHYKKVHNNIRFEGRTYIVPFALTLRRPLVHDCEINEWVQELNKSAKAPGAWNILLGSIDKLWPH